MGINKKVKIVMPFVGSCCDPGTTLVSPAVVAAFGGWPGDPGRILEDQSMNRGSKHGKCHGGPRGFGETFEYYGLWADW